MGKIPGSAQWRTAVRNSVVNFEVIQIKEQVNYGDDKKGVSPYVEHL